MSRPDGSNSHPAPPQGFARFIHIFLFGIVEEDGRMFTDLTPQTSSLHQQSSEIKYPLKKNFATNANFDVTNFRIRKLFHPFSSVL